jgi:hypothetical protein
MEIIRKYPCCGKERAVTTKIFLCFLLVNLLVSCGLNNNPPSYIKDFIVYKEGYDDSYVVYFILADASGKMTTANGNVSMEIAEEAPWYINPWDKVSDKKRKLYEKMKQEHKQLQEQLYPGRIQLCSDNEWCIKRIDTYVNATDFQNAEVGQGAFEHKVVLYSLGRITLYSKPSNFSGKVYLSFKTTDRKELKGETDIIF